MPDEVTQEEKAGQATGFSIDPEIFLAAVLVFGIAFAWIGLAFRIPAALIAALTLGTIALVTGDLVWSLDFLRAANEATDEGTKKALELERDRFNRIHRPLSLLAGSLAFIIFTGWTIIASFSAVPDKALWAWITLAANVLIGLLLWLIGPILSTGAKSGGSENAGSLIPWLRYSAIVIWVAAPACIGSIYSIETSRLGYFIWFYRAAGILALALQAELFIRASWSLISPKAKVIEEAPLPTLIGSVSMGRQYRLGMPGETRGVALFSDSRLKWMTGFFRQSLPRVVIGILAIMWLATSFVQVGVSEQGVRERFGRFTGEVLEPGVHIGWPWPIDRVRRFPSRRLHIMQIGFQGEESATRTNLIWTEAHGVNEDRFVTANGNEVISFDIELYYGISDVIKFAYTSKDPETLLKDIAYKAILLRTNATDSDSLLSRDRSELARGLQEDIQRACDEEDVGIDVSQVAIIAIHPPFEVASYYQAVVSMQVYADTLAIQASTYREEIIPTKQAEAQVNIDQASAYAARRVAVARGEAGGFTLVANAARQAFDVYRFRRRISALETGLEGKRLFIVSSRFIESEDGENRGLWFDLR